MIPKKNDEIYLSSSFKEINLKIKENRILREKFFKFYNFFEFKNENFKIASGHQPYIFHPGIWAKIIFLNFFDYKKIFITNDSDVKEGLFIDIPIFDIKWRKIREYIYLNSEKKTFEEYDFYKFKEGIEFFLKRFKELEKFIKEDIKEKILIFTKSLNEYENFVSSIIFTRRNFEKNIKYEERIVSEISKEDNFLKFFLYFFYEGEKIFDIYNKSLEEYRILKNIKKEGEPFPFLFKYDDFYEIPFWIIKNGRKKIFKNKDSLYAENEKITDLSFDFEKDIEKIKNLKIRPRALTLSIYQRIFLSDLFIHGIGGTRYDEFTEKFFENAFNLKMPEFIFITGTFYLFQGEPSDLSFKISELIEKKNFLTYHPEKFLKNDPLVNEKLKLVEEIKNCKRNKREISKKIKNINERLREKIDGILKEIEKEIEILMEKKEEEKVKYYREYPYFYFDYERIKKAIEKKYDNRD